MVKLKEIAQQVGVSPATVSNVLNGKHNMSNEVKEKILRICEEMGYDASNHTHRPEQNKTIVFNFSDFDRSFYLDIIKGISECLTENGYDLIVCTNKSSKAFMKPRLSMGAISLDGKISDEQLILVAKEYYPIVVLDRIIDSEYIKSVIVNNGPAMCELVQKLIDKGYRRFGFVGGMEKSLDNIERFGAFIKTLKANNIIFDKRYYFHGDYREKSGYQAAKLMLLGNTLPQILICASDNMALGAMRAFRENGFNIPTDIAVTGFDDCESAAVADLTTVSIPRYENGYLAAKELLNLLDGEKVDKPFKLDAKVIWRGSC